MKTWQTVAAEELGETLDGKSMERAIGELRKLVREEGRAGVRYENDEAFLSKFLRTCKLDTKRAFKMVNNYYANRASYSSKVKRLIMIIILVIKIIRKVYTSYIRIGRL